MFKLFSKNKAKDTEFTQEIQEYRNVKSGRKALLARIKFVFYLATTLILLIALAAFSYTYSNTLTKDSIASNRSVMVNVITEEIIVGALYNSPETEDEEPITADTPEAISNTESNDVHRQTTLDNDGPKSDKKSP